MLLLGFFRHCLIGKPTFLDEVVDDTHQAETQNWHNGGEFRKQIFALLILNIPRQVPHCCCICKKVARLGHACATGDKCTFCPVAAQREKARVSGEDLFWVIMEDQLVSDE